MAKDVKGVVKVEPLNLHGLIGTYPNKVKRIGIELEGAWKAIPENVRIERDASVFKDMGDDGGTGRTKMPGLFVGEIPVGKMEPGAMTKALKKYYPTKTDESCGMHVHMSFATLFQYQTLMNPQYQETLIHYLLVWAEEEGFPPEHNVWGRLKGQNEYCQKKYWPDQQVSAQRKDYDHHRTGHRYTAVVYAHQRHGTIESRVLPMMADYLQAARAVKRTLDITTACLFVLAKGRKTEKVRDSLILPAGEIYREEMEERV